VNLADSKAPASAARLISNGRHRVVISAAGGGPSRCNGLALNRWSGDRVEDDEGYFFYLRGERRARMTCPAQPSPSVRGDTPR